MTLRLSVAATTTVFTAILALTPAKAQEEYRPLADGVGATLVRLFPAEYGNEVSTPRLGPNPRLISNEVFAQSGNIPDPENRSDFVWAWGQFLDHDLSHVELQQGGERLVITIPPNDPVFREGQQLFASRSKHDPTAPVREQINTLPPAIDGSQIYGGKSTDPELGEARSRWLRLNEHGVIKMAGPGGAALLLQGTTEDAPEMEGETFIAARGGVPFISGDVRANEHAALLSLHTLFQREHNRVIIYLWQQSGIDLPSDPTERDNFLFESARRIVSAEIQAITFNEYLPVIGVDLPPANTDTEIPVEITNAFATAAFRSGHSQISPSILRLDDKGITIPEGNLALVDSFFNPSLILDEGGIEPILKGLSAQVQQATDARIDNGLRTTLFSGPDPTSPLANGTDLAALNILRGREHGLPSYTSALESLGFPVPTDFTELNASPTDIAALESVYQSVKGIDLWVGLLTEPRLPDSIYGPTAHAIVADQFARLRDNDAYFFERDSVLADLPAPEVESSKKNARDWVSGITLGKIISLNTPLSGFTERATFSVSGRNHRWWSGFKRLEDNWLEGWIGTIASVGSGWYWHPDLGWIYPQSASGGGLWIYLLPSSEDEGSWIWTSSSTWPSYFDTKTESWK